MKRPAIFLDRDGVLIHEVNYLNDLEKIKLFEDVPVGLKKLKEKGYRLIMITNQSGVARGYFTEEFVKQSYDLINEILGKEGVTLDAMFYCPHHVDGKPPYNDACDCRKPEPGMIEQAMETFDIDREKSFMIGDKLCDVELGKNAGFEGILLKTGHGKDHVERVLTKYPDNKIFENFTESVAYILNQSI